jgi:hypothetical protein
MRERLTYSSGMNILTADKQSTAIQALIEGNSIRSTERMTGVHRDTIMLYAISTSFIERQNLTIRMQMRRFTRLTNGFSKKLENLKAAVALHFAHYNFCRVHTTLRVTPAMEAKLADHIWDIGELLSTIN